MYVPCPVSSPLHRKKCKTGLVPNHVEHATWKEQRHLENHSTISEEITEEIPDDWKNSPLWDSYFISQFHLEFFFSKVAYVQNFNKKSLSSGGLFICLFNLPYK